ncbi:hypothetical protein J4G37_18055 [Microvirga sp. 3-52]|nr:hypothetical protein [Microvirga sp. 3-52]
MAELYHCTDRFLRGARSRGVAVTGAGTVLRQVSQSCWREALGSPVLVQV